MSQLTARLVLIAQFVSFLALSCLLSQFRSAQANEGFEIISIEEGLEVKRDGQLVTRYLLRSGAKPILWPIVGPNGAELTRQYPMVEGVDGEASDHPHHRSCWFTHGDVNGVSFWHENNSHGNIVHREFLNDPTEGEAKIHTANDWIGPEGRRYCSDERLLEFGGDDVSLWIDFTIVVKATDGEVTFGDTKEGSFGVRVAGPIKEDAGQGGRIMTSEGLSGTAAWGKPARWVDYHGPIDGETVGLAIMNHPTSFGFPSHWHVRTYGLFAANPFGLHDFYGGASGKDGTLRLEEGDSFTLKYRVYLHSGDHEEGRVEAAYENYVGE